MEAMMRILSLCMILVGVQLAFAQAPSKAASPFEQELVNTEKQFHEALQAKNVSYVKDALAVDFMGIGTNGDFYDRDEVVGTAREGLPKNYRMYDVSVVRLDESAAIVTYNEILPGSRPRYLHMSDTWTKQGGQWRLKFQQATPNLWSATDPD